jgi:hypothetical protein
MITAVVIIGVIVFGGFVLGCLAVLANECDIDDDHV